MNKKRFLIIFSLNLGYLLLRHLTVSSNFLVTTPFSRPIIPAFFRLIPEFISYFFFVYCLFNKPKNIAKYWWFFLYILFFSSITSSVITIINFSSTDFIRILASIRSQFIWLSPFFVGMTLFERKDLAYFYKSTIIIGVIQVPLIILQSRLSTHPDVVTGLMGEYGTGILAIFQSLSSLYLLEYILSKRISLFFGLMLESILILPVILGESIIIFLILPIYWILFFLISKSRKRNFLYGILIFTFLLLMIFSMLILSSEISGYGETPYQYLRRKISIAIQNSPISYSGPTRIYYLEKAMKFAARTPTSLFFGNGIGFASSSRLSPNTVNENILEGSTGVGSLFISTLLENGYFGIFVIVLFLGGILVFQIRYTKIAHDQWDRNQSAIGISTILLLSILIFYNLSFTAPTFAWILMPQLGIYSKRLLQK